MKVRAIQHKDVEVELYDDEIYRITRQAILNTYDLPNNPKIIKNMVCDEVLVKYDPAPYDPDIKYEEVREATEEDYHALAVLDYLRKNQP
jgi:hypothetical protein